jgi:CheY-like chemotaxis protein
VTRARTLLLVEDDPGVRRVVRGMLRGTGYAIREAANGRQALDAVAESVPDVMVLDIMLPELNGLEVLDHLRASGVARQMPIITMTGSVTPESLMRQKGARGVLHKPFSVKELHGAVEMASSSAAALP